jgi:hypothetical protein
MLHMEEVPVLHSVHSTRVGKVETDRLHGGALCKVIHEDIMPIAHKEFNLHLVRDCHSQLLWETSIPLMDLEVTM